MLKCDKNNCYFTKDINIDAISKALHGVVVSDIKDQGTKVKLKAVHSQILEIVDPQTLKNKLQEGNPNIEIVYDEDTLDDVANKQTKPIWSFKVKNGYVELERV